MKSTLKLPVARAVAESLVAQMRPCCRRIAIAGSIRRGRDEVGDVEIVAVPKIGTRLVPDGLFDAREEEFNLLHEWCDTKARIDWHKRGERQRSGTTQAMGVKVDLFLCTPENWGYIFLLRTGDAEFCRAVVMRAPKVGLRFEGGRLWRGPVPLETREECDVFRLLNLPFVEPHHRTGNTLFSRGRRDAMQLADDAAQRADETLSEFWNGENNSPGKVREARKKQRWKR